MRIDIATLFPEMCETVLSESIIGRARRKGLLQFYCHNIRDYTQDKHRRVDDAPYGGGMGMVMQADPIYRCFEDVAEQLGKRPHVIYLSPQGKPLTQAKAAELSKADGLLLLCGHYEGVDERLIEEIVDEEISIGDYVLTGGELPALVLADALCRLVPGVLSDEESFTEESHYAGLLEYPQYTRPPVWHGREVPEVLFTGHHANIKAWRREQQLLRTMNKRPDMLENAPLDKADLKIVRRLRESKEE